LNADQDAAVREQLQVADAARHAAHQHLDAIAAKHLQSINQGVSDRLEQPQTTG